MKISRGGEIDRRFLSKHFLLVKLAKPVLLKMLIIISHSCVILKRIPTGFKFKLYLFYETARINIVFYSIVAFGTKGRIQWNLDIKNLYITKSFGITNDFLYPSNSKIYEKQPR